MVLERLNDGCNWNATCYGFGEKYVVTVHEDQGNRSFYHNFLDSNYFSFFISSCSGIYDGNCCIYTV
ncbi:hypothetical protein AAZX31_01G082200 [Glycine max]